MEGSSMSVSPEKGFPLLIQCTVPVSAGRAAGVIFVSCYLSAWCPGRSLESCPLRVAVGLFEVWRGASPVAGREDRLIGAGWHILFRGDDFYLPSVCIFLWALEEACRVFVHEVANWIAGLGYFLGYSEYSLR